MSSTVEVAGGFIAPWLAAAGAIPALITDCSIEVEPVGEAPTEPKPDRAAAWCSYHELGLIHPFGAGPGADGEQSWSSSRSSTSLGKDEISARR